MNVLIAARPFLIGTVVGASLAVLSGPALIVVGVMWALIDHKRFAGMAQEIGKSYTDAVNDLSHLTADD